MQQLANAKAIKNLEIIEKNRFNPIFLSNKNNDKK